MANTDLKTVEQTSDRIFIFMFCVLLCTSLLCTFYRHWSLSVIHQKCRIITIDGQIYIILTQCAYQICIVQVRQTVVNVICNCFSATFTF